MAPSTQGMAGPSAPSSQLCLDLGIEPGNTRIAGPCNSPQSVGVTGLCNPAPFSPLESSETPATSKRRGSFNWDWDWENGWEMKWAGIVDFEAWLKEEQLAKLIEFILSSTKLGKGLWFKKWTYVCLRQKFEEQKEYKKSTPIGNARLTARRLVAVARSKSNIIHIL